MRRVRLSDAPPMCISATFCSCAARSSVPVLRTFYYVGIVGYSTEAITHFLV